MRHYKEKFKHAVNLIWEKITVNIFFWQNLNIKTIVMLVPVRKKNKRLEMDQTQLSRASHFKHRARYMISKLS